MKIEKLNDNQIKFILNKTDLADRNIEFSELAYGSDKTQELFHEMMEQAYAEYGFTTDNTPLMIEAIPVTLDSIMIIVTKISNLKDLGTKLNLFQAPQAKLGRGSLNEYPSRQSSARRRRSTRSTNRDTVLIYSFVTLDDMTLASKRIYNAFNGSSSAYKNNGAYFLVLESDNLKSNYLSPLLNEYGQQHAPNTKSKVYLIEHGENIIKKEAVERLSQL